MTSRKDQIVAVIKDVCAPTVPDLTDGSRSLLESGLDSLDLASVIMALEEKFATNVESNEVDKLVTLDSILAYFDQRA